MVEDTAKVYAAGAVVGFETERSDINSCQLGRELDGRDMNKQKQTAEAQARHAEAK